VDANGTPLDPAPIALGGGDTSVEMLVDVEPGPGSWLVLSVVIQGAERLLRMRRLSFDGTVLDPEGLDLRLAVRGDLAYAEGNHWLLTTHEDLNGTERIMGRFVGEGTLPEPPNNVPLPPQSGAPVPLDAGPSVPSTGGATGASDAGGALPGAVDAGGGAPASSDGGCGCRVAAPSRANGLWAGAVALAWLARRRVPRSVSRALPPPAPR
jgi:MYXO-CTERM domain-containing protein